MCIIFPWGGGVWARAFPDWTLCLGSDSPGWQSQGANTKSVASALVRIVPSPVGGK